MPFDPNRAAYVDFETFPIGQRPTYPPVPGGVSIMMPQKDPIYYAFGHALGGNTHTWGDAKKALHQVWNSGLPIVFHNAKFDVDVAEHYFGVKRLPKSRYHDTMPMLFLVDPRADSYGLKPSAERYLGMAPDERNEVEEWLLAHQPVPGRKLSPAMKKKDEDGKMRPNPDYVGAYIVYAPVKLAAPYANGDLHRTKALAKYLVKYIEDTGMTEAYERERDVMMVLLDRERDGVRVAQDRLEQDIAHHTAEKEAIESWLIKRLHCDPQINWDSPTQVVPALIAAKCATKASLGVTATGKVQTNKDALDRGVTDATVLSMMRYRAQLRTCLSMFMEPWAQMARNSDGLIYTQWHSTRHDHGDDTAGARTGRLSSTPNFQNIPKLFKPHFRAEALALAEDLKDPVKRADAIKAARKKPVVPIKLSPMPIVRSYITPWHDGGVLAGRDFSGQEFRLFAHFEEGALFDAYTKDPWLDPHAFVAQIILDIANLDLGRTKTKNVGFGILYGMGLDKLAISLDTDRAGAKRMRDLYYQALPNISNISDIIKERVRNNEPIWTYGGRQYYVEPPRYDQEKMRWLDFTYKLLNVLIQGSAADFTKIAFLNFEKNRAPDWRLILNVHDELVVSAPRKQLRDAMECLRDSMESVPCGVPMKSEGEYSYDNWHAMEEYDSKGVITMRKAA